MLIEEHDDDDDPDVEGMEAFSYDVEGGLEDDDDDDDAPENISDDDDDEDPGLGCKVASKASGTSASGDLGTVLPTYGNAGGASMALSASDALCVPASSSDAIVDLAPVSLSSSSSSSGDFKLASCSSALSASDPSSSSKAVDFSVSQAREVMIAECIRSGNDDLLRRLVGDRNVEQKAQRDAATDVATILQKRAVEEATEARKRRKINIDEQRQASLDIEEAKANVEKVQICYVGT